MKLLKRMTSVLACCLFLSSFLIVPAYADDLEGTAEFYIACSSKKDMSSSAEYDYSVAYPSTGNSLYSFVDSRGFYSLDALNVPLLNVTGTVIVSLSYYLASPYTSSGVFSNTPYEATFSYTNHLGATGSGSADVYSFTPVTDVSYAFVSPGMSITAEFLGDELRPISNLKVRWSKTMVYGYSYVDYSNGLLCEIPSFRVISSVAPSEDLTELKNIASEIAQSNQILSAMYGDILAVCNSIYSRCGDIVTALQTIQAYFDSIIPVLNSISTNTANIYSTLNTYFDLILKAFDNQTLTLEQAIEDAELALETYLKPIVDYFNELEETTGESASSLPSHKTDLDSWASDSNGISADAQDGLAVILPVFTAFSFIFSILGIFVGLGLFVLIIKKGLS